MCKGSVNRHTLEKKELEKQKLAKRLKENLLKRKEQARQRADKSKN